jgi:hypothetical protein
MGQRFISALIVSAFLLLAHYPAARADLIIDGGFEPPNPTASGGQAPAGGASEPIGAVFGGPANNAWTVVNRSLNPQDVLVTSSAEYATSPNPKTYYNPNSGSQFLDLNGSSKFGREVGVRQAVATVPGTNYHLTFWIGNLLGDGTGSGNIASLDFELNGTLVKNFSSDATPPLTPYNGDGVAGIAWTMCTYDFTAASASTTLGFFNNTRLGAPVNGLDDVSLTVPEPSCLLVGAGIIPMAFRRPRRRR